MTHCMRKSARLLALLFLLLLALSSIGAAEDESAPLHVTVRVGYSSSGSMLYRDEDGHYRGYDALYLYEIARYTGWDYEFVPYDNWSQAVDDVAAGRIDILPTVLKTPQREQEMLFSLYPMASTSIALIARPGDERYVYGDVPGMDGARIGVRERTADTKSFEQWAAKNGLGFQTVSYCDRGDLLAALRAGDIDLAATSYAGEAQKFPAIAEFSPQAMYFAVNPQKPQLAARLDQAMGNILLYNSSFVSALERVAQPDKDRYRVLVSDREKDFIAALPPQRVALPVDNAPFSYLRDGKMDGIAVRLLERVAELTGLRFTYVPTGDKETAADILASGKADILGSMIVNHIEAQEKGLRLTTPYYQDNMALLIRKGRAPERVAAAHAYRELLEESVPDLSYETAATTSEALALLEDGRVDAIACDMATATYYASLLHRGDYEMKLLPNIPAYLSLALSRDADARLGFLLDRTIQYLVNSEMDEIVQRETNRAPLSISNILDRLSGAQANALVFLLVLAICLLAYFLWTLWHRGRLERRVALIEREHDSMTASLAWEKKIGHAQQDFFRYMDDNIMAPVKDSLKSLIAQGAASPESPLYEDYLRCGQIQDFMIEVRLLNRLVQGELAPHDWQAVPLAALLARQGDVITQAAARKRVNFTRDFSGIGDERVLIEPQLFTMTLMRVLSYLLKYTPAGGSLLYSASVSRMAEEAPARCVLWLFFHAPELRITQGLLQAVAAMRESAQKGTRTIYESMAKTNCRTFEERAMLIRLAILELLIPRLGGEWELSCTKAKGTEITVSLLLDIAEGEDTQSLGNR